MCKGIGRACGRKHPSAPLIRNAFEDGKMTEGVLASLRYTRGRMHDDCAPRGGGGETAEGEEGSGPGPPWVVIFF